MPSRIHNTADVAPSAHIGDGTAVWHLCQIRDGAIIGNNCILGRGVFVDTQVQLGNNVKVQNYVSIFHGVTIEDGVFVGPHVCFTNDLKPRAINPDGTLKSAEDWTVTRTLIRAGASLGANATIRCGITVGRWAMVGAGSVVTHNVPDYGLVYGNPARLYGFVCSCGNQLDLGRNQLELDDQAIFSYCPACQTKILIPNADYIELISQTKGTAT